MSQRVAIYARVSTCTTRTPKCSLPNYAIMLPAVVGKSLANTLTWV
jgi:hypothetical protein